MIEPPSETERTAYHEVGHLTVAAAVGVKVISVELHPGVTRFDDAIDDPHAELLVMLAGHEAERISFGSVPYQSRTDLAKADRAAYQLAPDLDRIAETVAAGESEVRGLLGPAGQPLRASRSNSLPTGDSLPTDLGSLPPKRGTVGNLPTATLGRELGSPSCSAGGHTLRRRDRPGVGGQWRQDRKAQFTGVPTAKVPCRGPR